MKKETCKLDRKLMRLLRLEKASNPDFSSIQDVIESNMPVARLRKKFSKLLDFD